jgi:hypothetical protein
MQPLAGRRIHRLQADASSPEILKVIHRPSLSNRALRVKRCRDQPREGRGARRPMTYFEE